MLYYLLDIIPRIQNFSKKLDEISLLTNQHWISVNEIENSKTVYIFRQNQQLLISDNGKVERGSWEHIGSNSLIIDRQSESYLFKHGFLDDTILALKVDGTETYALFVNETKYGKEINNIKDLANFLELKYLVNNVDNLSGRKKSDNSLHDKRLGSVKLKDGNELVFYSTNPNQTDIIEGCKVLLNGSKPNDGFYKSSGKRFEISNGILINEFYIVEYRQRNRTVLEIDGHKLRGIDKGNTVWLRDCPAPDGKYRLDIFTTIDVADGKISRI